MKKLKQISPTCLVLINTGNVKANVVGQSKRREKNCRGKYPRGWRNQNGENLVNLCESNNLETQVKFPIVRALFPVESINSVKIRITHAEL